MLAAIAPAPFRLDEFVRAGAWDPTALAASDSAVGSDGEAVLTDIVQRMLGDGSFNYDFATYRVTPEQAYTRADTASAVIPIDCADCYVALPFGDFTRMRERRPVCPEGCVASRTLAVYRGAGGRRASAPRTA